MFMYSIKAATLMALYSALLPHVEAHQWYLNGDHPDDHTINRINTGRVVTRHPLYKTDEHANLCESCQKPLGDHGLLKDTEVCPGDYILTHRGINGRVVRYTHKPRDYFESFYGPFTGDPQ